MRKNSDGQMEVVLENRQLLLTFFVIVGLCGVFFSLGYIVGRNTLSAAVKVTQAAAGAAEAASKPSPMPPAVYANENPQNAAAPDSGSEQQSPATDLNFYQSVEGKAPEAKLVPSESATPAPSAAARSQATGEKAASPPSSPAQPAAAPGAAQTILVQTSPAPPASGFLVQVSALTRREDANTLVELIKGKNLPVQVTAIPGDKLFHVVVGPYQNQQDAEHAKTLLEQDGFRPIMKH